MQQHSFQFGSGQHGVLAFAFGLAPDGSPGATNLELARLLKTHVGGRAEGECVAQWEVADALASSYGDVLSPGNVVWPPRIDLTSVRHPRDIARRLLAHVGDLNRPEGFVYSRLDEKAYEHLTQLDTLRSSRLSSTLTVAFNKVLEQRDFCNAYQVSVPQARVPAVASISKGSLGEEKRHLPRPGALLQRGQSRRTNRLILESVFFDELRPAQYLSTSGVCRWVVEAFAHVHHWTLFAHPDHQPRCCEALLRVAQQRGHTIEVVAADCTSAGYDSRSAQSWTRDEATFRAYEQDVATRRRCR